MNLYRTTSQFTERPSSDRDMTFMLALLLIVSVVRVVGALELGEKFGPEATLALLVVVGCFAHGVRKVAALLRGQRRT